MPSLSLSLDELVAAFHSRLTTVPGPERWQLEEHLTSLVQLSVEEQQALLDQVPAIWPVSHSLCFLFLAHAADCLSCLSGPDLPDLVREALARYETGGLRSATDLLTNLDHRYLCRLRGEGGLELAALEKNLSTYLHGLAGRHFEIVAAERVSVDGATICLPSRVNIGKNFSDNALAYRFIATFQVGYLLRGTFDLELSGDDPCIRAITGEFGRTFAVTEQPFLERYFDLFPDRELAADVFHLAESCRVMGWIRRDYAGLYRDISPHLAWFVTGEEVKTGVPSPLAKWRQALFLGEQCAAFSEEVRHGESVLESLAADREAGASASLKVCHQLYRLLFHAGTGSRRRSTPLLFEGFLQPAAVAQVRARHKEKLRQEFVNGLAAFIRTLPTSDSEDSRESSSEPIHSSARHETGLALAIEPGPEKKAGALPDVEQAGLQMFLDTTDHRFELPESLQKRVREITDDLGSLPAAWVNAGFDAAGTGKFDRSSLPGGEPEQGPISSGIYYDEWDFRRGGYRRNWCVLKEKVLAPVGGTFVTNTLSRHRGLLLRLKRQFEMLRSRERFVGRQRDGDDIDLDAVIEDRADRLAGLSGSDRLFVRLQRDHRDIAAVFLVDMSSSTEGWVAAAIQESLLLMSEALNQLGDRFAIYGFSGMRRHRSEFFRVKELDETYGDTVRGRIAAISPQDYTRMGPPIRHVTKLLAEVEARVRLLIILSDGKPEDYDDYKGDYAIEDTRRALIEARTQGVHPFCITIDRQARDYIAHMYGEVNYIFLSDVSQLPVRLPAVYRTLTT